MTKKLNKNENFLGAEIERKQKLFSVELNKNGNENTFELKENENGTKMQRKLYIGYRQCLVFVLDHFSLIDVGVHDA